MTKFSAGGMGFPIYTPPQIYEILWASTYFIIILVNLWSQCLLKQRINTLGTGNTKVRSCVTSSLPPYNCIVWVMQYGCNFSSKSSFTKLSDSKNVLNCFLIEVIIINVAEVEGGFLGFVPQAFLSATFFTHCYHIIFFSALLSQKAQSDSWC